MNDKLILTTREFQKNSNFDNYFEYESNLKRKPNSEPQNKEKWFSNEKNNGKNVTADINSKGLKVTINPNKISGKFYSYEPLEFSEFEESISKTKDALHSIGIESNLDECKVYRYDNSFDLHANYDNFSPIINVIASNLVQVRNGKKRVYENTVYYGNKTIENTIYDKTNHLKVLDAAEIEENIIRFENRHLKAKREKLILKSIDEQKYWVIRNDSKNHLEKCFFSKEPMMLENEYLTYLLELLHSPITITEIKTSWFKFGINKLDEELIQSLNIKKNVNKNLYQRNLAIKKLLSSTAIFDKIELIEQYEQLNQLFRKAM